MEQHIIDKWKGEHGDVLFIRLKSKQYYFRKPNLDDYNRLARTGQKNPMTAAKNMLLACVLSPGTAELAAQLDTDAGHIGVLMQRLAEATGADDEAELEKL